MYKLLFFIPSPRNIPEVKTEIVRNVYKKYDVIWMKYYKEIDAYKKARDFFLNSAENYDYLVILPDDLLINKESMDNLINELHNPSIDLKRYDVLAGICNASYINSEQMALVAASEVEIPLPDNAGGFTMWPNLIKFKDLEERPENILKCKFIGFSFYFVHRSVVEKVPFRSSDPAWGVDAYFGEDLKAEGISQYIDKRSRFVHLKGLSAQNMKSISVNPDVLLVGQIKPHIILVKREKVVKGADMIPTTIQSEVINTAPTLESSQEIQKQEETLVGKTQVMQEYNDDITWKKGAGRPRGAKNKNNKSKVV